LRAWCDRRRIPWIEFAKEERKDDNVERYRARFTAGSGVVLVNGRLVVLRAAADPWKCRLLR
jgi:hypothetical protein